MERVQVQLTEEQLRILRERASASNATVASLVRAAVDAWIAGHERAALIERALAAVGGFHSGLGDLAEHHDRYVDEAPP